MAPLDPVNDGAPLGESPLPLTEGEWQGLSEETGYALDHLRILTGPVCRDCWDEGGVVEVATERHGEADLCAGCYDSRGEAQDERNAGDA